MLLIAKIKALVFLTVRVSLFVAFGVHKFTRSSYRYYSVLRSLKNPMHAKIEAYCSSESSNYSDSPISCNEETYLMAELKSESNFL
jgi:hypothetical protein